MDVAVVDASVAIKWTIEEDHSEEALRLAEDMRGEESPAGGSPVVTVS